MKDRPWLVELKESLHRIRCRSCKRWMKAGKLTAATTLQRAEPPYGATCVECLAKTKELDKPAITQEGA